MSWSSDQLTSNIDMADIDKIVCEAENRHNYKEQCKENNLQFKKDFIFAVLLMLFFLSPLILLIIMEIASINS